MTDHPTPIDKLISRETRKNNRDLIEQTLANPCLPKTQYESWELCKVIENLLSVLDRLEEEMKVKR